MPTTTDVMEKIVALCKRRGFIFQSSEIYGGIGGFWDYGPLGTELKRNIKDAWWHDMVRNPPLGPNGLEFQMVGVDCSIIMNPKVWEASGHATGFADPMVDCKECKGRFREDTVWQVVVLGVTKSEIVSVRRVEIGGAEGRERAGELANAIPQGASASQVVPVDGGYEVLYLNNPPRSIDRYGVLADSKEQAQLATIPFMRKLAGRHNLAYTFTLPRPLGFEAADQIKCPGCQANASLTEPRSFNLMFKTHIGALEDSASMSYLRPETAQGIFANFQNVMDSTRVKIPFGIGQIGKAFRNEINPRNFTFRSREFEQMEIEFFCKPEEHCKPGELTPLDWYAFWRDARINWYTSLGIKSDKLRPRQQEAKELAHYSKACTDIEYLFPFSEEPQELEGVAHRGCYDLSQHGKFAKGKEDAFAVLDDETRQRYVPHVIEPSAGADRFTLAVICEAYSYDESRASPEFLKIHPRLAPIKAAVFPLVAKDGMPEVAEPIYREIKKHYPAQYDAKQSIGKRYARMDEAGTPFCFTIDGQSKEDGTVTVRNRDDATQIRIDKSRCVDYLRDRLRI